MQIQTRSFYPFIIGCTTPKECRPLSEVSSTLLHPWVLPTNSLFPTFWHPSSLHLYTWRGLPTFLNLSRYIYVSLLSTPILFILATWPAQCSLKITTTTESLGYFKEVAEFPFEAAPPLISVLNGAIYSSQYCPSKYVHHFLICSG